MSTTVTYKGSVIATVSNAVKKLLTKGKYLEDDITITDSGGGGSAVLETLQLNITPSESSQSWTETPLQGYDGFDEVQVTVSAIPSSYVGSGVTRQAAQTIHPSTSDQSIAKNQYLTGAQTIKGVLLTNLLAENIKSGVTVKVGDDSDDDCVSAVTGTYSGGGATYKTGTFTPTQDYTTTGNRKVTDIATIGFTPDIFIVEVHNLADLNQRAYALIRESWEKLGNTNNRIVTRYSNSSGSIGNARNGSSWTSQANYYLYFDGTSIYIRTTSTYLLPADIQYDWFAFKFPTT